MGLKELRSRDIDSRNKQLEVRKGKRGARTVDVDYYRGIAFELMGNRDTAALDFRRAYESAPCDKDYAAKYVEYGLTK